VTSFFRDPGAFDALARQAISRVLENRGPRDPVRIWVPGCATGEEAYSLAILMRESLDDHPEPPEVQIFASDINERALNTARLGIYATRSRRVLVIDDNVDAAKSLSLLLHHLGHEVETAHDGEEALVRAMSFRPAIVFCDIGLPGMDGYEVARRLRTLAETKNAALIALTGYGQDRDRVDAGTAGFQVHLLKPISLESLQDMLATIPAKDPPPTGSIGP
jgi:two-component system OmpR family response regulator